MRYVSLFSGIEAASVAWKSLGWQPLAFAEIDPFCCAVLRFHYPTVPNLGDVTTLQWSESDGSIDLLIGGSPCQSFSIAGQRGGLADARGDLTLTYFALVKRLRPRWVVWENVPGVLSDDNGRTFGTILGLLGQYGYGFAYRVLDAQWAGVPQRRRRVFLVAYRGDWRPPAAVLFEHHSLSGDSPPRRNTGESASGSLSGGAAPGVGLQVTHSLRAEGADASEDGIGRGTPLMAFHFQISGQFGMTVSPLSPPLDRSKELAIYFDTTQITSQANRSNPQSGDPCHSLTAGGHAPTIAYACNAKGGTGRLDAESETFLSYSTSRQGVWREDHSLRARAQESHEHVIIKGAAIGRTPENGPQYGEILQDGTCYTLNCTERHAILGELCVRRLTPTEAERLQGFPDGYTLVPYRGKPASDGPRYRAIGNSMAVPVVQWIGERIQQVERLLQKNH